MNYNITTSPIFDKELKILSKKHPTLKSDISNLVANIDKELKLANDLGGGFKKIRLKITSKGKGKAGGARIISFETIIELSYIDLIFAAIYDKGEFESINIDLLKKNLGM